MYPTAYHFVASIILLYIPYYIVMSVRALRDRLPVVIAVIGAAAVIVYIFLYDKSTYHIDNAEKDHHIYCGDYVRDLCGAAGYHQSAC